MKHTPPFRVGKKQGRAILDVNGLEVVIFPKGSEDFAADFCEWLNAKYKVVFQFQLVRLKADMKICVIACISAD